MVFSRLTAKAVAVLLPILGISWIFGILSVNSSSLPFLYVFTVFNSLQVGLLLGTNVNEMAAVNSQHSPHISFLSRVSLSSCFTVFWTLRYGAKFVFIVTFEFVRLWKNWSKSMCQHCLLLFHSFLQVRAAFKHKTKVWSLTSSSIRNINVKPFNSDIVSAGAICQNNKPPVVSWFDSYFLKYRWMETRRVSLPPRWTRGTRAPIQPIASTCLLCRAQFNVYFCVQSSECRVTNTAWVCYVMDWTLNPLKWKEVCWWLMASHLMSTSLWWLCLKACVLKNILGS